MADHERVQQFKEALNALKRLRQGRGLDRASCTRMLDLGVGSARKLYKERGSDDTYVAHLTSLRSRFKKTSEEKVSRRVTAGRYLLELDPFMKAMLPVISEQQTVEASELESVGKAFKVLDKIENVGPVTHAYGNFALVYGLTWARRLLGRQHKTARCIKRLHKSYYHLWSYRVSSTQEAGRLLRQLRPHLEELAPQIRWQLAEERGMLKDCFVVMPFSKTADRRTKAYWTKFFKDFITPALAEYGYRARRSAATPKNITKDIVKDLAMADLVLAVLTDARPNVWYELGARHALRQGTIMMIMKGQQRPFDVSAHGIIDYTHTDRGYERFVEDLGPYIESAEKQVEDSPVSEFLSIDLTHGANMALGRLQQSMTLIEQHRDLGASESTILNHARELQEMWQDRLQLSIIGENGQVLLHQEDKLIGRSAGELWEDAGEQDKSLYPHMAKARSGFRLVQFARRPNRITALAYDTVPYWRWLVAVESHYQQ